MLDIMFYIKLISGLGFIFAGFLTMYGYKKNPNRYRYGYLPAILFLLAGIFQLISTLVYLMY